MRHTEEAVRTEKQENEMEEWEMQNGTNNDLNVKK
jgi:hypothetical protein